MSLEIINLHKRIQELKAIGSFHMAEYYTSILNELINED